MKLLSKKLLLIGLLLQTNFLAADVFRHQDEYGNISYSDKPSANAPVIKPEVDSYRYKHYVARVYDGDTIILKNGERVRLLGINTPEIEGRYRHDEAGGLTAKKWLQYKLQHGSVLLEYDQQRLDKYDRLLAHLFLPSGGHINRQIVEAGLATLSIIPPNLRHTEQLQEAEQTAQQQGLGIWSMAEHQARSVDTLSRDNKRSGWQRFLATPTQIKHSRKYVRLILNNKVDIRIEKDNLDLFPDLENYLGKALEIRGWASRNKDHYSILVRHPSAIIVLK